uniref:Putative receptor protein kinase TMK1 n=1 Tax=Noccaea caerulescens TaxID=107243 RepID=A0A1J3FHR2_NOCCA
MKPSVAAGKGLDEFRAEVSVLTKVHHCNLVTFHGYCVQGNERHLVYQYMPQGSLARHLFQWKEEGLRPLEWSRRLTIALDVARGVEYLHTLSRPSQSYIHRDLKPENILLGDDMRARVSDFGLVRSTEEGISSIKTKFCGTFGYMPPEYALTGRVTRKLDVYSFGIILMELISGQRAIDDTRSEENTHILVWFRNRSLSSVIDETIQVSKETQHLQSISEVAQLALYCCANEPEQRPEMSHVVTTLSLRAEQWKPISEPEIKDQIQEESLLEQLRRWKQESEGGSSTDITG